MSRLTGTDAYGLMEAYSAVYAPQELTEEQVWEEVETWVNSLLEEGYDLSDYTWEEMYESYLSEMGQARTAGQNSSVYTLPRTPSAGSAGGSGSGGRRGSGSSPSSPGSAKSAPTAAKPTQTPQRGLGNIPPSEGTGIGGPSDLARTYGRDTTSYQAGGGARSGRGIQPTMQQGRTNLGRMDQGRPAPSGAKPTSGPSSVNPKSGLSAYSASNPAASPAKPTTPIKPTATATPTTSTKPTATATPTPAPSASPARPSLSSQADEIRKMRAGSLARQGRTLDAATVSATTKPAYQANSFDPFDVIKGHLLDEGYANTEEAALAIMANMSEEWRQSIVEKSDDTYLELNFKKRKKNNEKALKDMKDNPNSKEYLNMVRKKFD